MDINSQINHIRQDFPILATKVYDKPLVYFDNAATTQKPQVVMDTLSKGYLHLNANVHRGVHFLSQQATEAHEDARRTVAGFLNAASPCEIIFTRGTTESINLVASSFCDTFLSDGDEIVVSEMEHHSNIVPWQLLLQRKKIGIKVIPFTDKGELDLDAYARLLGPKTKLVSVAQVSNTLGTVNPVDKIVGMAHEKHIPVLIDGAQGAPHLSVDLRALDVDFYAFSGHKIYGPTGIGVLYGKQCYLDQMLPYQGGGEMIEEVSFDHTSFNSLPYKFEAGTPDFIGSTALAAAIRYVQNIGVDNIAQYETNLLNYATERLLAINGLRIFGQAQHKSAVISMQVGHIHHYDMGTMLDKLGLALRTGHHCAEPVMRHYGVEGMLRASLAFYNTYDEVDCLVEGIRKVSKLFND